MKRKVIDIISYSLLIAIIVACISVLTSVILTRNERIRSVFGFAFVELVSGSMSPTYDEGDYLLVKTVSADKVELNDVIVFVSSDPIIEGHLNTHRVIEINTDEDKNRVFTTKGDGNKSADRYPVYESDVVAKVVADVSWISKPISLLKSGWGYFIIIMIPILAVLIISIKQFVSAVKKNSQEETNKGESDLESEKDEN